jgi:uncharacterized protein YueI
VNMEKLKLNPDEFKRTFLGEWKVSERDIALVDRLKKYYEDTPDEMSNREAKKYWDSFLDWASKRGYTRKEINSAKKSIRI